MKLHYRFLFLLTLCSSLSVGPVFGDASNSVLADGGWIYTIQNGVAGELFPAVSGGSNDPVLALDIAGPTGEPRRLLVAGSEGPDIESSARLVYEGATAAVYVLWESRAVSGALSIRLVALKDSGWSNVIEISAGSPLAAPPHLLLTRDSFVTSGEEEGEVDTVERTVLHLAWVEASDSESTPQKILYAPAILEDGEYLGEAPIIDLGELDPSPGTASERGSESGSPGLNLQPGKDSKSVVATFLNPATGRVVTTEIRMLPGELADAARSFSRHVVEGGIDAFPQGDLQALAGGVGGMMVDIGWALHGSLRYYLSTQVEIAILDGDFQGDGPGIVLQNLADGAGGMMIDIGARVILSGGVDREFLPERRSIMRIPRLGMEQDGGAMAPLHLADPFHLIHFYVVANRPAPATGDDGLTYLSSGSGDHGLACWKTPGQLQYRETIDGGDGWTEVQSLSLGENLTLEQAEQVLLERVRRR